MKKVATITLNTAYDLVGYTERMVKGDVNRIRTLGIYPAGKGINVAKVLNDLEQKVVVSGFLGKENQDAFNQLFKQTDLEDRFLRVQGQTRINVKITEGSSVVTDLNFSGYRIKENEWIGFIQQMEQWIKEVEIVAVCGSLPYGISPEQFFSFIQVLKQYDVKVILDSSHCGLDAGINAKPWLVKPNLAELETWFGSKLTNVCEIISAGKVLKDQGIENVVISMGAEGAVWIGEQIIQAKPPKCTQVVSTVGAGDSMIAGLIYGLTQGWTQQRTLAFACAISAFAVSQSNVGINDQRLLQPILEQVQIDFLTDE